MKLGAHMPTSGGVWRALERGARTGCEVVQLFVKNNMQWSGRPFTPKELAQYQAQSATHLFERVFGHAGYLINLAAPPSPNRDKSIASLIQEIELATQLGLPFLVLHPGSHLGAGEEAGLNQLVRGLDEVMAATRRSPVRMALENTAGQGACAGSAPRTPRRRFRAGEAACALAVCLDTAHFFAAGYAVRHRRGGYAAMARTVCSGWISSSRFT
jgi:deoxyribonuclease-4